MTPTIAVLLALAVLIILALCEVPARLRTRRRVRALRVDQWYVERDAAPWARQRVYLQEAHSGYVRYVDARWPESSTTMPADWFANKFVVPGIDGVN